MRKLEAFPFSLGLLPEGADVRLLTGFQVSLVLMVRVALIATLGYTVSATSDRDDRQSRTFQIPKLAPVIIQSTNGDIAITGWDRPDVAVDIARSAPSLERLAAIPTRIEVTETGLHVTAIQRNQAHDADLRASISVHAPAGQPFGPINLFEGRTSIRNLQGGVTARVEHGAIEAEALAGKIRLETGIGDVRLEHATLRDDGLIRLRTFNGNVALGFATVPADARILALSLGGMISSEIPLHQVSAFGPRFAEATLGRGEPVVSIDVVNGNIRINANDR